MAVKLKLDTPAKRAAAVRELNKYAVGKDHLIFANADEEKILKDRGGSGTVNKAVRVRQYDPGNRGSGGPGAGSHDGGGGGDGGGGPGGTSGGGPHSAGGAGAGQAGGMGNAARGGSPTGGGDSGLGGGVGGMFGGAVGNLSRGADPTGPSMGTSVGGMGTNNQGYGPGATGQPGSQRDTSLGGVISRALHSLAAGLGLSSDSDTSALGPTGETIGQVNRNDLSPSNMTNVEHAYAGFANRGLGSMIASAFGINTVNPTAMSQPPGVDVNAPSQTGLPNVAVDPIGLALGIGGLFNPAMSLASTMYSGFKTLTGYRGPEIGLGNPGSIGVDNGTARAAGAVGLGVDHGGERPAYAAQPGAAAGPVGPAAQAAAATSQPASSSDAVTVATGRDRNWQTLLSPSSSTGTYL